MKTPITVKVAKLLQDKGYPFEFITVGNLKEVPLHIPTIADVVMWLYEKYGIWIYTKPILDGDGEWIFKGYIKTTYNFKAKEYQTKLLRLPTEAYEAAIEYTLNKLI